VLLVVGLLCGGLVSLLLLNVVLNQDSFTADELRDANNHLELQKEQVKRSIVEADTPGELAKRAGKQGQRPDEAINPLIPGSRPVGAVETQGRSGAEGADR
jgi:hypothetical protein